MRKPLIVLACVNNVEWGERVFAFLHTQYRDAVFVLVRDKKSLTALLKRKPDYVFYLHWHAWISKKDIKKSFSVSFHASPLPKYRGWMPVQNQVLAGETESVLTAFLSSEKLDSGRIIAVEPYSLQGDIKQIFASIEWKTIKIIVQILSTPKKTILKSARKQDETQASYCRKLTEHDFKLDSNKPLKWNQNLVRCMGAEGYSPAFLLLSDGSKLRILKTEQ